VLRLLSQCRMSSDRMLLRTRNGAETTPNRSPKWHCLGTPASSTALGPLGAECTPIKEVKKPIH